MPDPSRFLPPADRLDAVLKRLERLEGQFAQLRAEVRDTRFFDNARRRSSGDESD